MRTSVSASNPNLVNSRGIETTLLFPTRRIFRSFIAVPFVSSRIHPYIPQESCQHKLAVGTCSWQAPGVSEGDAAHVGPEPAMQEFVEFLHESAIRAAVLHVWFRVRPGRTSVEKCDRWPARCQAAPPGDLVRCH